jgi:hypothetical protein
VGKDRKDSETAEVDECWSVVAAGMGLWWSEVGAGVEQGRYKMRHVWPYLTPALTTL